MQVHGSLATSRRLGPGVASFVCEYQVASWSADANAAGALWWHYRAGDGYGFQAVFSAQVWRLWRINGGVEELIGEIADETLAASGEFFDVRLQWEARTGTLLVQRSSWGSPTVLQDPAKRSVLPPGTVAFGTVHAAMFKRFRFRRFGDGFGAAKNFDSNAILLGGASVSQYGSATLSAAPWDEGQGPRGDGHGTGAPMRVANVRLYERGLSSDDVMDMFSAERGRFIDNIADPSVLIGSLPTAQQLQQSAGNVVADGIQVREPPALPQLLNWPAAANSFRRVCCFTRRWASVVAPTVSACLVRSTRCSCNWPPGRNPSRSQTAASSAAASATR